MGSEPVGVDIFTSIPGVDFDAAWPRRVEDVVDPATGLKASFLSREDPIAAKLASARPQDLAELVPKQSAILDAAARLVKPGGGLIYATCSVIPAEKRADPAFLVANMIPTCISDDVEAARAVNRRTLTRYVMLPNYRNYWKEAGYVEEMAAIESAIAGGRQGDLPALMSDRWLADATLFGPAAAVREGVAAWREAGITTPILVPSSAAGNQLKAVEEIFAAFARKGAVGSR